MYSNLTYGTTSSLGGACSGSTPEQSTGLLRVTPFMVFRLDIHGY